MRLTGVILFIATFVRAEMSNVAHFLSLYTDKGGLAHLAVARRALGYALRTHAMGLNYRRTTNFNAVGAFQPQDGDGTQGRLHSVGDSDFGEIRSKSGLVVMLAGAAVLWRVVVQRTPAISPSEAEFYQLSTTVAETLHVRQLLEEFGMRFSAATQVFCDARAARLLAAHGASTSRTRHIHRRWHFTKFHTDSGEIYVAAVRGSRNPAHILCNLTVGIDFTRARAYLLGS